MLHLISWVKDLKQVKKKKKTRHEKADITADILLFIIPARSVSWDPE